MKAIVISGGGCKGAWGGGVAQYLIEHGAHYDMLVGTSTGSMLIPLIATENMVKLKAAYTTITQKDIFKVNPFKANAPDMELDAVSVFDNLAIRGQKTFGDSSNIAGTIKKFFTESDYDAIRKSGKSVIACVSNLTKEEVEYYDIKDCTYPDFCDWIQASGSFVPFMSVIDKNGMQYMDGGIFDPLPIQEAINLGATDIDVIVLDPKGYRANPAGSKNVFQLIARLTDCMSNQLMSNDELLGQLEAHDNDVKLNIYYPSRVLTNNSLEFVESLMLQFWKEGYNSVKQQSPDVVMLNKFNLANSN